MHRKSRRQFLLPMLLMLFLLGMAHGAEAPLDSTNKLDSLRLSIQAAQDSLAQLQSAQTQLNRAFQQINAQIYRYKQDKSSSNPLKNYRLQNALRTSQSLSDQIEKNAGVITSLENELQQKYRMAIQQIDLEIQNNLASSKNEFQQTKRPAPDFEIIQKLEKEKADYHSRLKTINVVDEDWKNLRIESDDTAQRIQMKTAILRDKLTSVERVIQEQNLRLQELEKDRKVSQEMLAFYNDLKLAVDDEQEFFDRSRVEELQDQIDELDKKIAQIKQDIHKMTVEADSLRIKIKLFQEEAEDKK